MRAPQTLLFAALLASAGLSLAHGDAGHANPPAAARKLQQDWGIAGDARSARRSIEVKMLDTMRFTPERIDVKRGETVRFVVRNTGAVMHEFVLGTRQANDAHAAAMLRSPGMHHDEPWMAHVPPGQAGEIVWTFNRAGSFDFACLIPGHVQAGMRGTVVVSDSGAAR